MTQLSGLSYIASPSSTVAIRRLEPQRAAEAKRVILSVAHGIFQWRTPLEEIVRFCDQHGEFRDVDEVQRHYFDRQGLFLVALDNGVVVGTGAIRRLDDRMCELKRLWLLPAYQGQGVGYRLIQQLFDFARAAGYRIVRLDTDARQERAIRFYERLGFRRIEPYYDFQSALFEGEGVYMEAALY